MHGWPDRFAYVDPRAKIEQAESDVTASVAPPLASLLLAYRHRLAGDFRMELDVIIPPSAPAPNAAVPPGFPGPFGPVDPMSGGMAVTQTSITQFGFLPASGKSRFVSLFPYPLAHRPQPVERHLVVERKGDSLLYDWDGSKKSLSLPTGTESGYFVWQLPFR